MIRKPQAWWLAAVVLYVLVPGHAGVPDGAMPIGLVAASALAVAAFATWMWWPVDTPSVLRGIAAAIAAAALVKLALGLVAAPEGWVAAQYANDRFEGTPERSTAFSIAGATRIDPDIRFEGDRFPVYFLNDRRFNFGNHREISEPFAIAWRATADVDVPTRVHVDATTRGTVHIRLDDLEVAAAASDDKPAQTVADVLLSPGAHALAIRYAKPAGVEGLVDVKLRDEHGRPVSVTPFQQSPTRRRIAPSVRVLAWAVHGATALLILGGIGVLHRSTPLTWNRPRAAAMAIAAMFLVLALQGLARAASFVGRTWPLSGGDDWLAYEMCGRQIAFGDLLMTFGQPLGSGGAYFYYPLYPYVVAFAHHVLAEDLSGIIFLQFVLLAVANIVVYHLAVLVFDARVAVATLFVLLLQEQANFVRYYTVTLLAENVYFVMAAATVYLVTRFVINRRRSTLAWAGIAGGLSSLARPSMMLFLVPAAAVAALAVYRGRRRGAPALASAIVFAVCWMAAVAPATIRNYVVGGKPVLITYGQATTFVERNLPSTPDAAKYEQMWKGTMASSAYVLFRIFMEHPADSVHSVLTKAIFSLGAVQVMGQRVHPELMLPSAAYLLLVLASPAARRLEAWPMHLFVATHVIVLSLSLPGLYGYRLILPSYLFLDVGVAAVAMHWWPFRHAAIPTARTA